MGWPGLSTGFTPLNWAGSPPIIGLGRPPIPVRLAVWLTGLGSSVNYRSRQLSLSILFSQCQYFVIGLSIGSIVQFVRHNWLAVNNGFNNSPITNNCPAANNNYWVSLIQLPLGQWVNCRHWSLGHWVRVIRHQPIMGPANSSIIGSLGFRQWVRQSGLGHYRPILRPLAGLGWLHVHHQLGQSGSLGQWVWVIGSMSVCPGLRLGQQY